MNRDQLKNEIEKTLVKISGILVSRKIILRTPNIKKATDNILTYMSILSIISILEKHFGIKSLYILFALVCFYLLYPSKFKKSMKKNSEEEINTIVINTMVFSAIFMYNNKTLDQKTNLSILSDVFRFSGLDLLYQFLSEHLPARTSLLLSIFITFFVI